jgi:diketogulonate reductase-like aldo/keto reductase
MMDKFVKLSNGYEMPNIGFGTWQTPDETAEASVVEAIKAGYRHIDTAAAYKNEKGVGQGIASCGVPREELFITTKLFNDIVTYEQAVEAINTSLAKLGLDYLDLYLVHWPNPAGIRDNIGFAKRNADVWRAMEEAVEVGKIKSIGISNFMPHHIEELMKTAKIKPVVNQILLNPSEQEPELVKYNTEHGMVSQGYSPLGHGEIFGNEILQGIADAHGKTIAQVVIRWHLQKGFVPLPKSVTPSRIVENFQVYDFELTSEKMGKIDALAGTGMVWRNPDEVAF